MYDFCEADADEGQGVESYLDLDTAIAGMIRGAWARRSRSVAYLIRLDTGEIEATGVFGPDDTLMVLRADGTLTAHVPSGPGPEAG